MKLFYFTKLIIFTNKMSNTGILLGIQKELSTFLLIFTNILR